jgi:hypothetical protein
MNLSEMKPAVYDFVLYYAAQPRLFLSAGLGDFGTFYVVIMKTLRYSIIHHLLWETTRVL